MLEPPAETPPEVEHELAAIDRESMRHQARRGGVASLAVLGFVPLLYAAGLRETWWIMTMLVLTALVFAASRNIVRFPSQRTLWSAIAANMLIVALASRIVSPFLIAPAAVIMLAMLFAMQPIVRHVLLLWAGFVAAVLVPWACELLGWLSPTTTFVGDHMILTAPAAHFEPVFAQLTLALFVTALPALAIGLARSVALDRRRMQRALQIQAWQLRQLVPRA